MSLAAPFALALALLAPAPTPVGVEAPSQSSVPTSAPTSPSRPPSQAVPPAPPPGAAVGAAPDEVPPPAPPAPDAPPSGLADTTPSPQGAGPIDAAATDASPTDASTSESAATDASPTDASPTDAGPSATTEPLSSAEPPSPELTEPDATAPPILAPVPEAKPVASEDRPWFAVKVFIGLVGLLALAYLGGHPLVLRLERKIGVSRVVAAGFPFLGLGLLAHRNDILTDDVLGHMRPILHLALGWIGLVIGMRIELGKLSALPRGTVSIIGISTGLPLGMIVAGCGAVLIGGRILAGEAWLDPLIVRDALVLGAAGAIAADTETLRYGARRASSEARRTLVQLATLDELAALVGLAFLNAYFRPTGIAVTWQLPSTAWLFVTFGLALVVGVVVYAIVRLPATRTESVALLLGSVAFAAGTASTLHLSPLVVCFVVGMLLANFPGDYKSRLTDNLARLEMPIYLVFLIVAGAMWRPNLLGWTAMLVLLAARFVGRWVGGRIVWRNIDGHLPADARRSLVFAPMGALPIAVAVNAALLYPDGELSTILTATIGGAILCELALALVWRREELPAAPTGDGVPR